MAAWIASDIPAQRGRLAIVTGATGGLGLETALELARAGARVILAARDSAKGSAAIARIRAIARSGDVRFELLNLADLASINAFAERVHGDAIDLLINNAGVMAPPTRRVTADGFELQFGTNFLGHFALTALLLPQLRHGHQTRVVTVSSFGSNFGKIDFDDLESERSYRPMVAYNQSKLANLLFAFELERRSQKNAWGLMSVAAHPGLALTELIPNGAGRDSIPARIARVAGPLIMQTPALGALPILFAAASPSALGGGYYGPGGFGGIRGATAPAKPPQRALDPKVAARLWDRALQLTRVGFDAEAQPCSSEPIAR